MGESLIQDVRYALRGMRRAPLFAASTAATIGLGLGLLCSAFTVINAYLLRPIDVPDPYTLHAVSWDSAGTRGHRFALADFQALGDGAPHFSGLAAGQQARAMQDGSAVAGLLVTGNYFQLLGVGPALGRLLTPDDASAPGTSAVVVLSHHTWRSRYGSDPAIVGKAISFARRRFEIVGVAPQAAALRGQETVAFWAPLTMAQAFGGVDPFSDPATASLVVVGRLGAPDDHSQAHAWLDTVLRRRFPPGSEAAPVAVRLESLATRIPFNRVTLTLLLLLLGAFSMVLLVACANVTNLMLARALGRHQEIAVRLSLGASRARIARQLIVESLVLAIPASAVGLALTMTTARALPALIVSTFPPGIVPIQTLLAPLDLDLRVIALLVLAAIVSAALIGLAPAARMTRLRLAEASRGQASLDVRRSRLRAGLVAMQIGACVLFLVGASALVAESGRVANPAPRLSYEQVVNVRIDPPLRAAVAARLASDPAVERVAVTWQGPLDGALPSTAVRASATEIEVVAGYMVVSPDYFPLFDIRVVRGRTFTAREGDEGAGVVLVSAATAQLLWPGLDPVGQTLEVVPPNAPSSERRPSHARVRVIGVTEDVVSGSLIDGVDATCIYFATGIGAPGETNLLVRGRADTASVRAAVAAAVETIQPDATFQSYSLREFLGGMAWVFQAFSATASLLGVIGLLLAFSGTYAVVAFLVQQRTREFGVRMALGATVRQIVLGMLAGTLRTAAWGVAAGLAAAMALSRAVGGTLPTMPPFGLDAYLTGTAIVLAATTVAALLPTARVARIDPSQALRVE